MSTALKKFNHRRNGEWGMFGGDRVCQPLWAGTRMNAEQGSALGAVAVEAQTGRGELSQRGRPVPYCNGL